MISQTGLYQTNSTKKYQVIINWLLEGLCRVVRNGFIIEPSVRMTQELQSVRDSSDTIQLFMSDEQFIEYRRYPIFSIKPPMLPLHTWRTNRRGAPPSRQDAPAKALRNRDIFLPTPPKSPPYSPLSTHPDSRETHNRNPPPTPFSCRCYSLARIQDFSYSAQDESIDTSRR